MKQLFLWLGISMIVLGCCGCPKTTVKSYPDPWTDSLSVFIKENTLYFNDTNQVTIEELQKEIEKLKIQDSLLWEAIKERDE